MARLNLKVARMATGMAAGLILAATPALADVKTGVDAWSRGDHAAAVKEWMGPAANGDPDAQFNLGQANKLGRGVPQDIKRAEAWYRKAAENGHIKAADTLGLLLFQDGRKEEAVPFLQASAERGDPRAQYIIGIAHFNGDMVGKDWVRAYALMSRASAAGLEQATRGLATMDGMIPLDQRQMGISLAGELEQRAKAAQAQQFAAADLGVNALPTAPLRTSQAAAAIESADLPPSTMPVPVPAPGPVTAGADFANPVVLQSPKRIAVPTAATPKPVAVAKPTPVAAPTARTVVAAKGNWRLQLGAFGVKSNADGLWAKVRNRPEIAGHSRIDLPSGSVTRLLAGGYASQADANKACTALKSGGFTCLVIQP